MASVRVVRAFRLPITAIITALALSGCMRTTGPVAVAPQGDLDSMAYGQANSPPPQAVAGPHRAGPVPGLPLSVRVPDGAAGTQLVFRAFQTYQGGERVAWTGAPDADEPAPRVTLLAPEED